MEKIMPQDTHTGPDPDGDILIRAFGGSLADLEAITRVRNETLGAITLPEDYREFSPAEMEAYYRQGDVPLAGNAWLALLQGEPVGVAIIHRSMAFLGERTGNFHLYVAPAASRRGVGSALLGAVEREAAKRGYPALLTTVAAEDSASARFLSSRRFIVIDHSHHLVRGGSDRLPAVTVPGGYELRSLAELGEGPDLYRETANRLGAYDSNTSLIREETLHREIEAGRFRAEGVLFLVDLNERVVGVIRASLTHEGTRGYLNEVRLEPSLRGKGLGMALVAAALTYLARSGATRVELDTPGENTAGYNLALAAGFVEARHWLHFMKRVAT